MTSTKFFVFQATFPATTGHTWVVVKSDTSMNARGKAQLDERLHCRGLIFSFDSENESSLPKDSIKIGF